MLCQRCFKEVSRVFKESVKCVFKKMSQQVSRVCFSEILFCSFVVAWISSQLPEQKEGLLVFLISCSKLSIFPAKTEISEYSYNKFIPSLGNYCNLAPDILE